MSANKIISSIKTPLDSVNDDSVIVTQVYVEDGQSVKEGDVLAEIETSKALVEIISDANGFVKCLRNVGEEVIIGTALFTIYEGKDIPSEEDPLARNDQNLEINRVKDANGHPIEGKPFETRFSSMALDIIFKDKLDKNQFSNFQFVTTQVIDSVLGDRKNLITQNPPTNIDEKYINNDNIQKSTRVSKQKFNEIKYLSSVNSAGLVSRLSIPIRATSEAIAKAQNFISSTPLPIVAHECSRLLLKYKRLNSFYFDGHIKEYGSVNIGVAFDNGINGLKVANLTNCNSKNLLEIEQEISDLSIKYNQNKLSLKEIGGSTFTITDLFSAGIENFHPLVNYNNSAVLGICGINNNSFNVELSFDHRISSGLEVSGFLNELRDRVESRFVNNPNSSTVPEIVECQICLRGSNDDLNGNLLFLKVSNSKFRGHICSNCFNGL